MARDQLVRVGRRHFLQSSLTGVSLALLSVSGVPPLPIQQAAKVHRIAFLGVGVALWSLL